MRWKGTAALVVAATLAVGLVGCDKKTPTEEQSDLFQLAVQAASRSGTIEIPVVNARCLVRTLNLDFKDEDEGLTDATGFTEILWLRIPEGSEQPTEVYVSCRGGVGFKPWEGNSQLSKVWNPRADKAVPVAKVMMESN